MIIFRRALPFLFVTACSGLVFGASQAELWQKAQQAENDDRIDDAVGYLQQAVKLPGSNLEDVCLSLEAYAEVLKRPSIFPQKTCAKAPESPSSSQPIDLSGNVTIDATATLSQQLAAKNRYDETGVTPSVSAGLDWSLEQGRLTHILSLAISAGEYLPLNRYDPYFLSTSPLAHTYSVTPSLSYTLFWNSFYASAGGELPFDQGYAVVPGLFFSSGTTLLQWDNQKWKLSAQTYQSIGSNNSYALRTAWSRQVNEGITAALGLGFLLGIDTSSTIRVPAGAFTDSLLYFNSAPQATGLFNTEALHASSLGPEISGRIGYQGRNWHADIGASFSVQRALHKDSWNMDTTDYNWFLDTNAYRSDPANNLHATILVADSLEVDMLLADNLISLDQATYLWTYEATHPGAMVAGNVQAVAETAMDIRSYRQMYQKASVNFSFGANLQEHLAIDFLVSFQQKIYLGMPTSHPLFYTSLNHTYSARCGLTYDF